MTTKVQEPSDKNHDCEAALAVRLKALREFMEKQDGELERLMAITDRHQKK
jgi:hypothetical protein